MLPPVEIMDTTLRDGDQTEAAIKATLKMLNIIEINYNHHES